MKLCGASCAGASMLTQLRLRDFVLIDRAEFSPAEGFCALTGETGVGKSVLVDALSLLCGGRAGPDRVRPGAERAEIEAVFLLPKNSAVRARLAENGLDDGDELIARRVVARDGAQFAGVFKRAGGAAFADGGDGFGAGGHLRAARASHSSQSIGARGGLGRLCKLRRFGGAGGGAVAQVAGRTRTLARWRKRIRRKQAAAGRSWRRTWRNWGDWIFRRKSGRR